MPPAVAAEVLAVGLDGLRRDAGEAADGAGQHGQHRGVGLLQGERDRVRIRDRDLVDRPEREDEGERARVVERVLRVEHAIEVELDRVGVEVAAVVELHALAQREGVGLAVRRHGPGFGEARFDVEARRLVAQQPVVDVAEDPEVADRHGLGRVERLEFRDVPDDQGLVGRLGNGKVGEPHRAAECPRGGGAGKERAARQSGLCHGAISVGGMGQASSGGRSAATPKRVSSAAPMRSTVASSNRRPQRLTA